MSVLQKYNVLSNMKQIDYKHDSSSFDISDMEMQQN